MEAKNYAMGDRLRDLRKTARLTQTALAVLTGLSARDIQNIEGGALTLPYRKYRLVASYFGISAEALIGEEVAS